MKIVPPCQGQTLNSACVPHSCDFFYSSFGIIQENFFTANLGKDWAEDWKNLQKQAIWTDESVFPLQVKSRTALKGIPLIKWILFAFFLKRFSGKSKISPRGYAYGAGSKGILLSRKFCNRESTGHHPLNRQSPYPWRPKAVGKKLAVSLMTSSMAAG